MCKPTIHVEELYTCVKKGRKKEKKKVEEHMANSTGLSRCTKPEKSTRNMIVADLYFDDTHGT